MISADIIRTVYTNCGPRYPLDIRNMRFCCQFFLTLFLPVKMKVPAVSPRKKDKSSSPDLEMETRPPVDIQVDTFRSELSVSFLPSIAVNGKFEMAIDFTFFKSSLDN